MVAFGNLRPINSNNHKLVLYYDPKSPNPNSVKIDAVSEDSDTAQWNGTGLPPGNLYLIHTGANAHGTLYLTMADDKPNQPTYMEKWLGSGNQYDPRQVWLIASWEGGQRSFITMKGHILQAPNINEKSSVIVGAYPEYNTDNPKPKGAGQIWLGSTKA